MIYENNKVRDLQIAYIGGGSRAWAWTFMTDLALDASLGGTIRLYDIDEQAARRNEIIGKRLSAREDAPGKWDYVTCPSLEEALDGADFVVISILPGTFDEMESDVHLPERLGIWQSVGDTAGPGGAIRALRTIPIYVELAEAIRRYAPTAWVINYTNPMALCVRTLYEVFPQIKAFGCCHEVFGTQEVLRDICQISCALEGIRREEIQVNVQGVNHFTWFTSASYKGIDLFPVYRDYIDKHYEEGYNDPKRDWRESSFNCAHRVKFDLFRRYGRIAAAGDRHLAEFMPGDEYLKDPETIRSWKFSLTPVSWRKADLQRRLERSERLVRGEEEIPLQPTGEEGIRLIRALCGLERLISNVNIPNFALQIPELPARTVVETNALFERDAIRPVFAGSLTEELQGLLRPHVENQDRILRAALTGDRELLYQAFFADPLVKGRASEAEIRRLADDMIAATAKYLPAYWA